MVGDNREGEAIPFTEPGWDARVRGFHCGDEVDVYAIVTRRFVVFVDTGATPEQAERVRVALAPELASRQPLVVITHADYDHCWGNAAFAGPSGEVNTPIIGHALAREWMQSEGVAEELRQKQAESPRFASVRLIAPTITYTDRLVIDGGDLTLELLHTPGHTPDHTAVWIPGPRLLLAGDAAEQPFPQVHSGADLPDIRRSLARLQALDAAWVLPCHGGVYDPSLLARNLAFFATIERHARTALESGSVPGALDGVSGDELERLAGYTYVEALAQAGAKEAETPAFYRQFFDDAVRSTFAWLRSHT
ncbi:MAG TPA: MBL fold metallo-hydrolase [Ktedonobacterales bacterium]|nr:MBL fold metallo-hydrolase [Ktedonobacterales bacterium]